MRQNRGEDELGQRPTGPAPPIITDKDLKGFDEILENDVQDGWAAANSEIDYNAKLVFSDDEDGAPTKDSNYDEPRDQNKQKVVDWDSREYDVRKVLMYCVNFDLHTIEMNVFAHRMIGTNTEILNSGSTCRPRNKVVES